MRGGAAGLLTLLVIALLVAMSLVPWRQSRALEVLAEMDRVERELTLARAEKERLREEVEGLESRERVVREARERLGLRMPSAREVVILDLGTAEDGAGEVPSAVPDGEGSR